MSLVDMVVDTAKINKLKDKFSKYPPYAIKRGLEAMTTQMNTMPFKSVMYPPSQSGSKFVWSSDKQRRFVFANIDLPSIRTYELASSGEFRINEQYFTVEYQNLLQWAKFVIHPSYQIIGHRLRGWKPVNQFIVSQSGRLVPLFKPAALAAWDEMENLMFGGGAGI